MAIVAPTVDKRKFEGSGLTAGVESGLSSVEKMTRNSPEKQQSAPETGAKRKGTDAESAGSKGGKSFTMKKGTPLKAVLPLQPEYTAGTTAARGTEVACAMSMKKLPA